MRELGDGRSTGGATSRWLMASDVCKHCTHAACLDVCPTGALFRTEFGTVVVQEDVCNGCGYCVPACPFGVIDQREDDGRVWKCTLCYDRLKATWDRRAPRLARPIDPVRCRSTSCASGRPSGSRCCTGGGGASARLYGEDPDDGVEPGARLARDLQHLQALEGALAHLVERPEGDRLRRARLRARRGHVVLEAVVAEGALVRATVHLAAIDDAVRAGRDAIPAAVADVLLHDDGAELGAEERARRAHLQARGRGAVLAHVGGHEPAHSAPSSIAARRRRRGARSRPPARPCCRRTRPVKSRPSSGTSFHSLQATSHALQPMQIDVSVKKPTRSVVTGAPRSRTARRRPPRRRGGGNRRAARRAPAPRPAPGTHVAGLRLVLADVDVGVEREPEQVVGRVALHDARASPSDRAGRPGAAGAARWSAASCAR